MKEYIEREAAKNAFPRAEADAFENCRYCTCLDSEQIGEILDNIPAADVVPVVHGEWIGYPECLAYEEAYSDDHIICSICTMCFSVLDNCTETFKFCPNCGATMEVEHE